MICVLSWQVHHIVLLLIPCSSLKSTSIWGNSELGIYYCTSNPIGIKCMKFNEIFFLKKNIQQWVYTYSVLYNASPLKPFSSSIVTSIIITLQTQTELTIWIQWYIEKHISSKIEIYLLTMSIKYYYFIHNKKKIVMTDVFLRYSTVYIFRR